MNYNGKKFKVKSNSTHGVLSTKLVFHYEQQGQVLTCRYQDENNILEGHLLGWVDAKGKIDMRYHQLNQNGELMTGICTSRPEIMPNGKIRLHENWQWTSGDQSTGSSILEEV